MTVCLLWQVSLLFLDQIEAEKEKDEGKVQVDSLRHLSTVITLIHLFSTCTQCLAPQPWYESCMILWSLMFRWQKSRIPDMKFRSQMVQMAETWTFAKERWVEFWLSILWITTNSFADTIEQFHYWSSFVLFFWGVLCNCQLDSLDWQIFGNGIGSTFLSDWKFLLFSDCKNFLKSCNQLL